MNAISAATAASSINAHCSQAGFKCKECALIKWIGLLLTTMASQNGTHSALVQAEREKIGASTLPHQMCPRKQTTEPKWLILVSFFLGEVTSYIDTSYCIHVLWEVSRSVFSGPPYIDIKSGWREAVLYNYATVNTHTHTPPPPTHTYMCANLGTFYF